MAFIVLGSTRVEPLDFWWAPLNVWMLAAYAVIITGGLLITRRLHLLALAATFWVSLAIGIGILAGSGHCMVANWAFAPVCGIDFWRVIVTSPEVLIFLFFMITDPKTVPAGRVGRIVFGLLVAMASTLLMAPQTNEFGTKVALLAGLVVMCAARPLLDRVLPEPRSSADDFGQFASRLTFGGDDAWRHARRPAARRAPRRGPRRSGSASSPPARQPVASSWPTPASCSNGVPHAIDPATLPDDQRRRARLGRFDQGVHRPGDPGDPRREPRAREPGAPSEGPGILTAVDHGDRLDRDAGTAAGSPGDGQDRRRPLRVRRVHVVVIAPFGVQTGGSIGFDSKGTVTQETYDASGPCSTDRPRRSTRPSPSAVRSATAG